MYSQFAELAYKHQDEFLVIVGLTVMFASVFLHRKGRKQWRKMVNGVKQGLRGKVMGKRERQEQYRVLQSDAIFNALEELVANGKVPRNIITKTYRQLAGALYMPDFVPLEKLEVPTHVTQEEFDILQSILRSKHNLKKLILEKKRIPIPGPKPGEIDNVLLFEKKAHDLAEGAIPKSTGKFGGDLLKKAQPA